MVRTGANTEHTAVHEPGQRIKALNETAKPEASHRSPRPPAMPNSQHDGYCHTVRQIHVEATSGLELLEFGLLFALLQFNSFKALCSLLDLAFDRFELRLQRVQLLGGSNGV